MRSAGSAVDKGESLKDTIQTLSAYDPAAIVIRSPHVGAAELVTRWTPAAVVNAGDGKHEHPTQALLDVYTLRHKLGVARGRSIWIVGDVAHSRVARSNILAFRKLGAEVTVCGPPTLLPRGIEALGCNVAYNLDDGLADADVVYALRMQRERMTEAFVPSLREYAERYQIDGRRLQPRQLLMHPGPVNRGVELAPEVIDSPQAAIAAQVQAGVVVRMAVLYELLAGGPHGHASPDARCPTPGAAARVSPPPLNRMPAAPADLLVTGAHVLDPRTDLDRRVDVLVRGGEIAELGEGLEAPEGVETVDARRRPPAPRLRRPARAPARPGPGAQGGHRDRDPRRRRGRVLRDHRHAEHVAADRQRLGAALGGRAGQRPRPRSRRLPRRRHRRPAGPVADRDGRAARRRRARVHRRRQSWPVHAMKANNLLADQVEARAGQYFSYFFNSSSP